MEPWHCHEMHPRAGWRISGFFDINTVKGDAKPSLKGSGICCRIRGSLYVEDVVVS